MMTSLKRRFSVSNEESQNRALEICAPKENTSQDDIHPADTPATARDSAPSSLKRRKTSDASASVFSGLLPSKRLAQFLQQHSNNSTALVPSMASNSYDTMHHRPNITKISQKQTVDGIADASEQQLLEQHKRVRSNVTEKAQKLLKGISIAQKCNHFTPSDTHIRGTEPIFEACRLIFSKVIRASADVISSYPLCDCTSGTLDYGSHTSILHTCTCITHNTSCHTIYDVIHFDSFCYYKAL